MPSSTSNLLAEYHGVSSAMTSFLPLDLPLQPVTVTESMMDAMRVAEIALFMCFICVIYPR